EDSYKFVVENSDIYFVYPEEIIESPWLWSALMWGGIRDASLIRKLARHPNLEEMSSKKLVSSRQGIIKGQSRQRLEQKIIGRLFLRGRDFPIRNVLRLDSRLLDIASQEDALIHE